MRLRYTLAALAALTSTQVTAQDLLITGVIDGPRSGGVPKAIEVCALDDIPDLSRYALESVNSGAQTAPEFTFPEVALAAGECVTVASESPGYSAFFGEAPDYINGVASINGDDSIVLYYDANDNGTFAVSEAYDVFGVPGTDGTGSPWDYEDGWAYRNDNELPTLTFDPADWTFSGANALDAAGTTGTNGSGGTPAFPLGQYDNAVVANEPMPAGAAHRFRFLGANPSAAPALVLEVAETQAVRAEAYDAAGRRVATLADGTVGAGQGTTLSLRGLPAGRYFVRVTGETFVATQAVTVSR